MDYYYIIYLLFHHCSWYNEHFFFLLLSSGGGDITKKIKNIFLRSYYYYGPMREGNPVVLLLVNLSCSLISISLRQRPWLTKTKSTLIGTANNKFSRADIVFEKWVFLRGNK